MSTPMRSKIILTTAAISLCSGAPALADPHVIPAPRVIYTAAPPAPSSMGGGFIEYIFSGNGTAPVYAPPPEYSPPIQRRPDYRQSRRAAPEQRATVSDLRLPPNDPRMQRAPVRTAALAPETYMPTTRPVVPDIYQKQLVRYSGKHKPGTIVIDTQKRFLYLVQGNGEALRYGIGVGREGFQWRGSHRITMKREWPDWRPPAEMIRRQPHLPRYMPGGPKNPLGARAMYLGSTLYRIHGSNEPWTIGQAVSSGCIRMTNDDVSDLYSRVRTGTTVVVL